MKDIHMEIIKRNFYLGGMKMRKLERAIERIHILECPTDEVAERLKGIMEDYGVAKAEDITIEQKDVSDITGAQRYDVQLPQNNHPSIRVIAQSGLDDYVAKVTDVYME